MAKIGAVLVACAVLVAACGGDSDGSAGADDVTRPGFVLVCSLIGDFEVTGDEDPSPRCPDGSASLVDRGDYDQITQRLDDIVTDRCAGQDVDERVRALDTAAAEVGFPEFWAFANVGPRLDARCPDRPRQSTTTIPVEEIVPTLTVRGSAGEGVVDPYSYCWRDVARSTECVDGEPAHDVLTVRGSEITIESSEPLDFYFVRSADPCTVGSLDLQDGGSSATITVQGPPGLRRIEVFGLGILDGTDAAFAFTIDAEPSDQADAVSGSLQFLEPTTVAAEGRFALEVRGAAVTDGAMLAVTISGEGGDLDVELPVQVSGECYASFSLTAVTYDDLRSAIGDPPYDYTLALTSGDRLFTAEARWPRDRSDGPSDIVLRENLAS